LLRSPTAWHYASLAVGLAVILVLQSDQWFFFDEWSFLQLDDIGPMAPHVGHWSVSPTLVYEAFRAVFGLDSYFPFSLAITLVHVAAAHVIWRISIRANANPWIATSATVVFLFLGTGAENILWGFQIGYVGALLWGLIAFLLATAESISTRRFVAILALTLFSLTWSGTAVPLVVATTLMLLWRAGWRKTLIFVVVTGGVYLGWYLGFQGYLGPDTGGLGLYKLFVEMPQFIGVLLILGFGDIFPVPVVGFVLLLFVAGWLVFLVVRKQDLRFAYPALALGAASVVFAFMSAYSRASMAVGAGRASRYVYLLLLLLLPLFAVALTRFVRGRMRVLVAVCIGLLVLAGYQSFLLVQAAASQSTIEQRSDRVLSASLQLYVDGARGINLDAVPDPRGAPDMMMSELIDLYEHGYLPIDDFTAADMAQARASVLTLP
jgi:hypothetical protein